MLKILVTAASPDENEEQHRKSLDETGFWGRRAAGALIFATSTKRFLLAHRSADVQEPNTWGIWGGAIDEGEEPKVAVLREIREETGYHGRDLELWKLWTFQHESGFRYFNFLATTSKEFTPKLDWETQGFKWVEFGAWPKPLHPGVINLLKHESARLKALCK